MLTGNNRFTHFRSCYVCTKSSSENLATVPYLITSQQEMISYDHQLVKCQACGNYFINPVLNENVLNEYYNSSSSYEMYDSVESTIGPYLKKANQQFDFISSVSKLENLDILDFGCATGYNLASFKKNNNRLLGFDTSAECSAIAKKKYDIVVETDFTAIKNRKFDLIMLSHVLEHLSDPYIVMESLGSFLKEGGLFYVEIPDVDFLNGQDNPNFIFEHVPFEHLNYFNKASLTALMKRLGFRPLKINTSFNDQTMMPNYSVILSVWEKGVQSENNFEMNSLGFERYLAEQTAKKDQFKQKIMQKVGDSRVVVYGAGTHTYRLLALCPDLEKKVCFYADSNVKKQDKEFFNGKKCMNIQSIPVNDYDLVLISSESSENEIYKFLKTIDSLKSKKIEKIYN